MEEIMIDVINTTINSFDITFCICVNIVTYLVNNFISEFRPMSIWNKRIVLLISIVLVSICYIAVGTDTKLILNSAILAPVFWSWIAKPVLAKFGIEYTKINDANT